MVETTKVPVYGEPTIKRLNKKRIALDMASLGIAGGSGYAGGQFNPTSKAMDLIVDQLEQSGATINEINGNTINHSFPIEAFDYINGEWVLKTKMDFSGVPDLYSSAANLGAIIGGTSIGAGLALRLLGKKKGNEVLEGTGKVISRAGGVYGLIRVLTAKIGLGNMPYSMGSDLAGYSGLQEVSASSGLSSIDIAPIVQHADGVMTIESILLGSYLVGDSIATGVEYARNKPSKAIKELNKNRY
jgi:hypothetical protein